jgi:N-acetylmuramoyl-L-alanine amidase
MIVVDAGHGGHDPGAKGVDGAVEKEIVLPFAKDLARKLAARLRVTAVLTRFDDSFVPLEKRLPPADGSPAVFVSLHANSAPAPGNASGVEIFYGGGLDDVDAEQQALRLGTLISSVLRERHIPVRGVPRLGTFTVLTRNPMPGVLVELGYLTHPDEVERLRAPRYRDRFTDALVTALDRYLREEAARTMQGESPHP